MDWHVAPLPDITLVCPWQVTLMDIVSAMTLKYLKQNSRIFWSFSLKNSRVFRDIQALYISMVPVDLCIFTFLTISSLLSKVIVPKTSQHCSCDISTLNRCLYLEMSQVTTHIYWI